MPEVLFIQGGGETNVHDSWDNKLVNDLRRQLGGEYEVRYPRMPYEDDPSYATWAPAIRREIAALGDGGVVIGHSIGGTILIQTLTEHLPEHRLEAIVLISAPFVGEGGWPGDEFQLARDLGAKLPSDVPVHLFQGLDDDITPPAHADLYFQVIPQAEVHRLSGRDHQLNNDLSAVAQVVGEIGKRQKRAKM